MLKIKTDFELNGTTGGGETRKSDMMYMHTCGYMNVTVYMHIYRKQGRRPDSIYRARCVGSSDQGPVALAPC